MDIDGIDIILPHLDLDLDLDDRLLLLDRDRDRSLVSMTCVSASGLTSTDRTECQISSEDH